MLDSKCHKIAIPIELGLHILRVCMRPGWGDGHHSQVFNVMKYGDPPELVELHQLDAGDHRRWRSGAFAFKEKSIDDKINVGKAIANIETFV